MRTYDVIVIGGGFFGCEISNHLASTYPSILILEKSHHLMQQASYANQARVHNGYHYPKSLLTAIRSRVNFPKFCRDYKPAITSNFDKYYAIARRLSNVSSRQYTQFCKAIKADVSQAEAKVCSLFSSDMIEEIFKVTEYAFDADILRKLVLKKLKLNNISVELNSKVERLSPVKTGIKVYTNNGVFKAKKVINATYSGINWLNKNSGLPVLPLKNELTEMLLIKTPPILSPYGLTVMCGPFFSLMPFPARKLHTLSHVRYTPHFSWLETEENVPDYEAILRTHTQRSAKKFMLADAARYIPDINKCEYVESIWAIKTVLPSSEKSDSRPILFYQSSQMPGYFCLMGGKIDNIYDVWEELNNHEAFKA